MIELDIPGYGCWTFRSVVFDLNGTLAVRGAIPRDVSDGIRNLSRKLKIYVVTADTFGTAEKVLSGLPVTIIIIGKEKQAEAKRAFVERLGRAETIAVGNGSNDMDMLKTAALGICVIGHEGAASIALRAADVVVCKEIHALELLLDPLKLTATLRR